MSKIMVGYHLNTGGGKCRWWKCRVFCLLGVHRWSWPGGWCECCGKKDDFPFGDE